MQVTGIKTAVAKVATGIGVPLLSLVMSRQT